MGVHRSGLVDSHRYVERGVRKFMMLVGREMQRGGKHLWAGIELDEQTTPVEFCAWGVRI